MSSFVISRLQGSVHFYVMPFVKGESLRTRLTKETPPPVDAHPENAKITSPWILGTGTHTLGHELASPSIASTWSHWDGALH